MAKSAARLDSRAGTALWIYNPWLDLLVGCGAWSAPLLLFASFADTRAIAWSAAFYGLALFFNYPHYMATIYRAYHTAEDFRKYRIFTVHITALILLTLVVSHFWYRALPWIFTLYLTWSPWHYSGQNYGLFMMFARRAGAKPSHTERRALYSVFLLSYLILILSFHTGPSTDPLFVSLGLPGKVSLALVLALAAAYIILSTFGLSRLVRQVGWRPLFPSLTLFSTQFLWFLLPTAIALAEGLQITQSRYSNGVLAVMHSAQYLWITSYYARREANAEGQGNWRPFAYFGVLVAEGIALFVPGPWLASRLFHYDFTASFLLFTALVNIHHFILDGAIWKLRDGRIAALLLNSKEKLSDATAEAGGRLAAGARWLVSNSRGPRALRLGAASLLLTWGTIDQVRYYLSLHQDNLADLQRAATLDSFDSTLQMRLGRKAFDSGNTQQAAQAWRQAVRANPANPAPRNALLRYLTEQKHFDEAYALTTSGLRYVPRDIDLLVNHGVLAKQLGHFDQAVADWQKAISLDSRQSLAQLYLANEFDREGKLDAAIPHYMSFLELAAKAEPQNRLPAGNVIAVALRLAQCQEKANRPSDAEKSYELAQTIASQVGQKRLESLASIAEAGLEAKQKKVPEALHLYQHALTLDRSADDRRSEADDWYSYALFLRGAGFPPRLAYACLVRSESLMQSFKDSSELQNVALVRDEVGSKLSAQAVLRRNPQPALEEALTLSVQ
jgi:tetratricopeptide (TPR) repeat protein